jgi:molecular chaperone DnaK (HSP70)
LSVASDPSSCSCWRGRGPQSCDERQNFLEHSRGDHDLGHLESDVANLDLELSREEYEDMIAPFIEETLGAIHIALESAGLTSSQVDEILLVGGATRTPLIRRRLVEAFGTQPRGEVDPDLCVAIWGRPSRAPP